MTRFLRRLAFVYLIAAVLIFVLAVIETALADAATPGGHATPVNFLDQVPVPYLAALLAANVIPYLSALATKHPGWWTGAVTVGLSLLDAVLAAVAHAGNDSWTHVAAVTAGAWIVARLHLRTFLSGTKVESDLHAHGYTGRHRVVGESGAVEPRPLFLACAFALALLLVLTGHLVLALIAAAVCAIAALAIR